MKILKNDFKTLKYLDKLRKIYIVAYWAKWGVMEFHFSGKFDKKTFEPLVWQYNDHNGICDQFELIPLHWVTTGEVITYTFNQETAKKIANSLNKEESKRRILNENKNI